MFEGNFAVPDENEINAGNVVNENGLQQEASGSTATVPTVSNTYASMAAKTVANIKRLQVCFYFLVLFRAFSKE